MLTTQFPGLHLVSAVKAHELCESIARRNEGSHVVGVWCAMTGFAIRAVVVEGVPVQWFIRGPIDLATAREELFGEAANTSVH